jgi:nitrogenase-stabilizing/protective protein
VKEDAERKVPNPSNSAVDRVLSVMAGFSAAEEFLDYFGIRYEQAVVNVNRLHILKRFHQYMRREEIGNELDEKGVKNALRSLLERAYQDFVYSNAATEKVFKVLQQVKGMDEVSVDSLRMTLPSHHAKAD